MILIFLYDILKYSYPFSIHINLGLRTRGEIMATSDNTDEKLTTQDDFSELFIKLIDVMVDYEHFGSITNFM